MRRLAFLSLAALLVLGACADPAPPPSLSDESEPVAPEPADSAATTEPVAPRLLPDAEALPPLLSQTIEDYVVVQGLEPAEVRTRVVLADLNGDGADEALVRFDEPTFFCEGAGCTVVVFQQDGGAYAAVSSITGVSGPVTVLDARANGWRDLAVPAGGRAALLRHDGVRYPGRPAEAPTAPPDADGERAFD